MFIVDAGGENETFNYLYKYCILSPIENIIFGISLYDFTSVLTTLPVLFVSVREILNV